VRDQTGDARFGIAAFIGDLPFSRAWSRSQRSGSVAVCAATVAAGTVTGRVCDVLGYVGYLVLACTLFRILRAELRDQTQQPDAGVAADGAANRRSGAFRMHLVR